MNARAHDKMGGAFFSNFRRHTMKTYRGLRPTGLTDLGTVTVTQDGKTRPLTKLLRRYPFHWGCIGAGNGHLAFALIADATGNEIVASKYYQDFARMWISGLPDRWTLTDQTVRDLLPID